VPGVRRVFVERLGVHVYFTFDRDSVVIRAVWGPVAGVVLDSKTRRKPVRMARIPLRASRRVIEQSGAAPPARLAGEHAARRRTSKRRGGLA